MTKLSKDVFATGAAALSVEAAVDLIMARVPAIEATEMVGLFAAEGRVLAQTLAAAVDLPPFDNSAVDGYAARWSDLAKDGETKLPVAGRIAAGHTLDQAAPEHAALRIFTGAPVPEGFDTIFMQEDCSLLDDGQVLLPPGLAKGANLRPRGEELAKGAQALPAGRRLMPEDIGLAAALGVTEFKVRRRLKAAIFSTGDEIVSPGMALPVAAVYDANRFMLHAMLQRLGVEVEDLGILPDDRGLITTALGEAAKSYDLVVTSGGVSMGEEDHVKAALEAEGSLAFWKLAIKPGRPVAMGILHGTPFIGLPGNPVAVFVCFAALVRPLIAALNGATAEPLRRQKVVSGFAFTKKPGRREYLRVSLRTDAKGEAVAEKYAVQGSGALTSLTRTRGLVELREETTEIAPGDRLDFIDFALMR
ncbi:gephyrin-like molybdotransferase Glp [Methylovirgula sp. HY1]|uniref:molybdopterin molybdotransferase MoeA n=1 Tax=Methylovirgula sp. HY1 TaxID=2822761 RepID=UPI001C5B3019|nr:gephyrin-like molybdotransferase Glp [Methylovirgula sp. HY1]QXX74819.1 Molybdopterin molybdenumtransferase [Methylovirgula sp. HY1]